jgi:hypothetical protein
VINQGLVLIYCVHVSRANHLLQWQLDHERTAWLLAYPLNHELEVQIMDNEINSILTSVSDATQTPLASVRRAWSAPLIEDADISALTDGSGSSGVEGSSFLKPGS